MVSTSLHGKSDRALCKLLAGLAITAADLLADEEGGDDIERLRVKRLQVKQGSVLETILVNGLMLLKSRVDKATSDKSEGGLVAIIDGGLESKKLEINASIEVDSPGILQGFHDRKIEYVNKRVENLESLGVELLIVRDGISDEAVSLLTKAGITAYRRFERKDMELLSNITGAKLVRDPLYVSADDIGSYSMRSE